MDNNNLKYAEFIPRGVAYIIDCLILFLINIPFIAMIFASDFNIIFIIIAILFILLIPVLYFTYYHGLYGATITITAPNNNLTNGNFVRIKDIFYNLVPDGIYYVDHVKNNSFCVFGIVDYPNDFPPWSLILNPEGFWQKIPAKEYEKMENCSITIGSVNNVSATIDLLALPAEFAAICEVDDMVYISGVGHRVIADDNNYEIKLPDGFYIVKAIAEGGQYITVQLPEPSSIAPLSQSLPQDNTPISVTKIGKYKDRTIDNDVMTTVYGLGSNVIRLYDKDPNYKVGDNIKFCGLPDDIMLDGMYLYNNFYTIINVENYYIHLVFNNILIEGYAKEVLNIIIPNVLLKIIEQYYIGTALNGYGDIDSLTISDLFDFSIEYYSNDNNIENLGDQIKDNVSDYI